MMEKHKTVIVDCVNTNFNGLIRLEVSNGFVVIKRIILEKIPNYDQIQEILKVIDEDVENLSVLLFAA